MKVGHFVSLGIGGADRATYNLAMGLKALGTPPVILFSKNSFPSRTADQDPHLPLLDILSLYESEFETHRIEDVEDLSAFNLDILHTHQSGNAHWLLPGLGALNRKFRIVETNFHGFQETPADFRIFPSQALMEWRRIPLGDDNAVIPNAILSPSSSASFRYELGLPTGAVILGRVARADNNVFSASLLKVYRNLKKSRQVALVWVGASEQARESAEILGLRDVIWIDPVQSPEVVSKWMNTFDVFCHFNKLGETFGNTVAEAMMHGLPVVSLAGSIGYPQAQKEVLGTSSRIYRSRGQAKRELMRLIDQPSIRRGVGQENQIRARNKFSLEVVAAEVAAVYRRSTGGSR
jgi:glycosyltransferase involved in cell wall biosynthesis